MTFYMGWPLIVPANSKFRPVDYHYLTQGQTVARWIFEDGRDKMIYANGGATEWRGIDVMLIHEGRPISRTEWNASCIPTDTGSVT